MNLLKTSVRLYIITITEPDITAKYERNLVVLLDFWVGVVGKEGRVEVVVRFSGSLTGIYYDVCTLKLIRL